MADTPSPGADASCLIKVILTGESGVGKTNLLSQFMRHNFNPNGKTTIGIECATKTLQINGQTIKAQIWDTAGQERFRAIINTYYHGANGALVLYDVTNSRSFGAVRHWLNEVNQLAEGDCVKMLIGNKVDLEDSRSVTTDEGRRFAEKERLMFLETSAKTAANVEEAFAQLIMEIIGAKTKSMFAPVAAVAVAPAAGIGVAGWSKCC